ncbi:signal recognition particle-docking protein FtsY [Roseomonas sp. CCTCC AB2023176]|uniref:signal recognition particle-docking protein FtsY n=1 Tax=Roseomonas sp. CCTCC AB2023176 TaxID=3342640 RepID=UPI0035DB980F
MALKDLWGRLTGRGTKEEPAETVPPITQPDHVLPPMAPMPGVALPSAPVAPHIPEPEEALPPFVPAPAVPMPPLAPPLPAPAPAELEPPPNVPPVEEDDVLPDRTAPAPEQARRGLLGRLLQPAPEPPPAAEELEPERRGPFARVSPPVPDDPAMAQEAPARGGFFSRLKAGLSRSTAKLTENITSLFRKRRLDDEALEELEDTLITADLGVGASRRIVESFRKTRFGKEVTDEEVKGALADEIADILGPVATPLAMPDGVKPWVVLVVGVNGTGKTTTIAKLAQQWRAEGYGVMMAAGDTFRAAAVEQLQIWGDRTGSTVVAPAKEGADAAGLAYDALTRAKAEGTDILLIDTAGRLHNKAGLMDELRKVVRVLRKADPEVPHATLLVLDATTGQNAIQQCKVFREMVDVTGLVVTKLDGSAKGGVVVALAQEFGLPVHAVGVGETAADLRPFEARDFARSLVGLEA